MIRAMNRGMLYALLLLVSMGVQAQQQSHIEAERMLWQESKGLLTFSGQVRYQLPAQQIHIEADELILYSVARKLNAVRASGKPVQFSQNPDQGKAVQGRAREIYYDAASKSVRLTGEAWLQSGSDTLQGETIIYDLGSQRAEVSGSAEGKQRFEAIIGPREEGESGQ